MASQDEYDDQGRRIIRMSKEEYESYQFSIEERRRSDRISVLNDTYDKIALYMLGLDTKVSHVVNLSEELLHLSRVNEGKIQLALQKYFVDIEIPKNEEDAKFNEETLLIMTRELATNIFPTWEAIRDRYDTTEFEEKYSSR